MTDIKVKSETDTETCMVRGIVFLPVENGNDRLALTDSSNKTLKILDAHSDKKVLSPLKLSTRPWDLAAISSNKVAVAMPYDRRLIIVSVNDNDMDIAGSILVNGRCYGVDFKKDKLAVSYCHPDKLQVLNIRGIVLYDISAAPLNEPNYLRFGQDATTLYVSNSGDNTVVYVKLDGTVVATYTDSELQGPKQIAIDNNGAVFVCALTSQTVHHITKDCKKCRVVLSDVDGLVHPRAICISDTSDRLFVGLEASDTVKVYRVDLSAH